MEPVDMQNTRGVRSERRWGACALVVLALLAGGCASTVQPTEEAVTSLRSGDATGPADDPSSAATTPDGDAGSEADGSVVGDDPSAPVAGAAAPGGAPGGAGTSGPYETGVPFLTQGITADTIKVGIPTIANAEAITGLLGAADLNLGDPRIEGEALIRDLNARGGIAGRMVEPVYAPVDFGSADVESSYLAACSKLADDEKVFAILLVLNPPPSFNACAASKGVIVVNNSAAPGDDETFASVAPWLYAPGLLSMSRVHGPLLDAMLARGEITTAAKVGVFAVDLPQYTRIAERAIIPALAARNLTMAAYERVATEASIQNAVLRFRQKGVTHVLFVQESAIPVLLFLRQAESQRFRPTYLLTSIDSPGYLLEGNVADEQLRGVRGIGWSPVQDVDASRLPPTPREQRCLDVIRSGGEPVTSRQSHLSATLVCELVWSFEAIASAAGPELSTVTFRSAFHGIGTGYQPVSVLSTDFRRVDGVSSYRVLGYQGACRCIDYASGPEPLA